MIAIVFSVQSRGKSKSIKTPKLQIMTKRELRSEMNRLYLSTTKKYSLGHGINVIDKTSAFSLAIIDPLHPMHVIRKQRLFE